MNNRIDFELYDEGGYFWLGSNRLAGMSLAEFINSLLEGGEALIQLLEAGECLPLGLYGDGGRMKLRLVIGDLTEAEASQWTAAAVGKLHLTDGQLLIGDSCDPDAYNDNAEPVPFDEADETTGRFFLSIPVPAGQYRATVYSYPPVDFSGCWNSIVSPYSPASAHPEAEPLSEYFARTRTGVEPPYWIAHELGKISYKEFTEQKETQPLLDFLIHLTPLGDQQIEINLDSGQQTIAWQSRKPAQTPLGIPFNS